MDSYTFTTNDQLVKDAEGGNSGAQCTLGMFIYSGTGGFQQNMREGVSWLQKSADQGNCFGLYYLADHIITTADGASTFKRLKEAGSKLANKKAA